MEFLSGLFVLMIYFIFIATCYDMITGFFAKRKRKKERIACQKINVSIADAEKEKTGKAGESAPDAQAPALSPLPFEPEKSEVTENE